MLNTIKIYFGILATGLIIGSVATFLIMHKLQPKIDPKNYVTTKNISGNPVYINNISTTGHTADIDITHKGEGENKITVVDDMFPSAYKWNHAHWEVGGFVTTDLGVYLGGGYRYDRFMIVGGPWFRNNNGYSAGLWVGGFFNF